MEPSNLTTPSKPFLVFKWRIKAWIWVLGVLYAGTIGAVALYLSIPATTDEAKLGQPTVDPAASVVGPVAIAGAAPDAGSGQGKAPFRGEQANLPEIGPNPTASNSSEEPTAVATPSGAEGAEIIAWSYRKCWDAEGRERHGEACDPLPALEQRIDERLSSISSCKKEFSGAGTSGLLDIMVEIDIRTDLVSIWNGVDSTLPFANPTVGCVAKAMRHMPLSALGAPYERYQLETTIEFKHAERKEQRQVHQADDNLAADLRIAGIPATVKNDKVRVRKTPVDGEIIGLISAGNVVSIIEQTMRDDAEWCRVLTPRKNIGWMVCWSLERTPEPGAGLPPAGE